MPVDPSVLAAIRAALDAAPDDLGLRAHLAALLAEDGRPADALEQAEQVLARQPDHLGALEVAAAAARAVGDGRAEGWERLLAALRPSSSPSLLPPPPPPVAAVPVGPSVPDTVDDLIEGWADSEPMEEPEIGHLQRPRVRLDDVGGLASVKERLERSFLAPMRNPELRAAFGSSLRGGLLLWGPPGCGKTFIARAMAGELGANFYEVGIADVLEMWIGSSERNLHSVFEVARRNAPCVLFFDELDALGHKRTQLRGGGGAMRGVVNQMLAELDGASANNEGVFVLAATNHPWDIDPAMLRPGRIDRTVLVLPPDEPARRAILATHLRDRPVDPVDLGAIAARTDGLSGADLALVVDAATEVAMEDSLRTGRIRNISQRDLDQAARAVRPSIGSWMQTAKNFATYSDGSGDYDELLRYLKTRR